MRLTWETVHLAVVLTQLTILVMVLVVGSIGIWRGFWMMVNPLAKLALLERWYGHDWFDHRSGRRLATARGKECIFGPDDIVSRKYCIGNKCMAWRWSENPSPLHWRRWLWENRGYCAATLREGALSLAATHIHHTK
jgi:hypothetical protein